MRIERQDTFSGQSIRYICVGSLVYGIDIGSFSLMVIAGVSGHYVAANLLSKTIAAGTGFFLHKSITFRWQQQHRGLVQLFRYAALLLTTLGLSSGLVWLAVGLLDRPPLASKVVTDVAVTIVAFLASRFLVFRQSH